jgi:hypothetical protein
MSSYITVSHLISFTSKEKITPSGKRLNPGKTHKHHSPQSAVIPHRRDHVPRVIKKVEIFAKHLSELFTPHDNIQDPELEKDLASHTHPSENLQAFTLCELKNETKMLNPHRAPGIDLIIAHMLKEMPHEGYLNLLHILNAIRRLAYWPTQLKQAKIIMIPKPGKNPTDVTSYRTISLLPLISKKFGETHTQKDIQNLQTPGMDTTTSLWFQKGTFHNTAMSSYSRYNKQNFGRTRILLSCLLRH